MGRFLDPFQIESADSQKLQDAASLAGPAPDEAAGVAALLAAALETAFSEALIFMIMTIPFRCASRRQRG